MYSQENKHDSFEWRQPKPDRDRVLGSQSGRGRRGGRPSERFSAAGAAGTRREGVSDSPEYFKIFVTLNVMQSTYVINANKNNA